MRLKYYLRGLGLGMVVTAMVCTLSGKTPSTLTDEQIKMRAKELGMIENTSLVDLEENTEPEPVVAEVEPEVEEEPEATEREVEEELEVTETDAEEEPEVTEAEVEEEPEVTEAEVEAEPESIENEPETTEETEPQTTEAEAGTPGTTETTGTAEETLAATPTTEQPAQAQTTLTVVSGDTSYSVAKKLVELGIGTSVLETDRYLCANGYDRTIRTGVYTIQPTDTLEDIARRINGK